MDLKNILLHPTSIPVRIRRRIGRRDLASLMTNVTGLSPSQSYTLFEQLELGSFRNELNQQFTQFDVPGAPFDPNWFTDKNWNAALYCIVRAIQPDIVVETGVASGVSSAFILKALHDSQKGALYSIDIPNVPNQDGEIPSGLNWALPEGVEPGFGIPHSLRDRWELIISPSEIALPSLLERLKQIDVFLHDSDHSYKHMMWEYKQAWPYIKTGGLLLSDDVGSNSAMIDFCQRYRHRYNQFEHKAGVVLKKA